MSYHKSVQFSALVVFTSYNFVYSYKDISNSYKDISYQFSYKDISYQFSVCSLMVFKWLDNISWFKLKKLHRKLYTLNTTPKGQYFL